MATRRGKIFKQVDIPILVIYVLLVLFGVVSICGATSTFSDLNLLDFQTYPSKQVVWVLCSFAIGFILMMLEKQMYENFAYFLYAAFLLLLLVTPFIAHDIKGSRSWISLGVVNLQPAEFAKFATALALAKFMSAYNFSMRNTRHLLTVVGMVVAPMLFIVLQQETGSALVYIAFFLMLYREGLTGSLLFSGLCAAIYFIVTIRFSEFPLTENVSTPVGLFVVFLLIILFTVGMMSVYLKGKAESLIVAGVTLLLLLVSFLFSQYVIPFDIAVVGWSLTILLALYLLYRALEKRLLTYLWISLFTLGSAAFVYSSEVVFNHVMQPHQQTRIKQTLGMEEDLAGAGYNVNQSKIAIGSGGITGKGFMNGTQTKLHYVPEQHTDFIFCTVGEEEGFLGAAVVLILFTALILRIIHLSEKQTSPFGRVYGYSLACILFFHVFVNIGMVLGLTPVIGIPLPFFSYGGSSLWGFTILLFIFLSINAENNLSRR